MSDRIQPWPLVKRGSQGHPVPALQYLLRDRGHHVTVDGIFGPKTEAAVEQFQIADQLRVDGIVGPQTHAALAKYQEAENLPVTGELDLETMARLDIYRRLFRARAS